MRLSENQMLGVAGQYLTCVDLLTKGLVAYPVSEGLPYDVILDRKDAIFRVQVKTCRTPYIDPKTPKLGGCYVFGLRKGINRHRKDGSNLGWTDTYSSDEVDIFALVALDIRQVGYILRKHSKGFIKLRSDNLKGTYFNDQVQERNRLIRELHKNSMPRREIAKQLGIALTSVDNHLTNSTSLKGSPYFSSVMRDSDWFWSISTFPRVSYAG